MFARHGKGMVNDWKTVVLGSHRRGKLADSQDSVTFTYVEVDPRKENFIISATFRVDDVSGADFQSGYGIAVMDTVASPSTYSRHRNHLLVGRFRSLNGHNYACGVRVVGGYTDERAMPQEGRRHLDPSRLFQTQDNADTLRVGDNIRFNLEKTDKGFKASTVVDGKTETIFFPGHDFLLRQDKEKVYVGFAVAGDIKINVSEVIYETRPGSLGHTPKGAIKNHIPDYPFDRSLIGTTVSSGMNDPIDLAAAISSAVPGSEIILPDGIYSGGPYYIPESKSGDSGKPIILRAEHPGKAVIDGTSFEMRLPAMTLRGRFWIMEGIVFKGSPSCGLFVCGSDNVVKKCEASFNGDTGILICSFPGVSKKEWPRRNRVERCVSHDNCDEVRCNADGFGAKLSVGKGNGFYYCRAFHNIDDGFDLYTKSILGQIAPVTLANCDASFNGWLSGEECPDRDVKTGIGFKLGGENQGVPHHISWCAAHHNARIGFDANSNSSVILANCEAWSNPRDYRISEKKASFAEKIKNKAQSSKLYIKNKLIPRILFLNPFSSNRSVSEKFDDLIPEIRMYYPRQVYPQLYRQAVSNGFWSLKRYYEHVVSDNGALEKLKIRLTFLGTHFFRGEIWPRLREVCQEAFQNSVKDKVRVWCAGCSEGMEIYSILMVLLDFLPAEKLDILATDYNPDMISKSRKGVYPLKLVDEIPSEYRHYVGTYLPEEKEGFNTLMMMLPSSLREMIRFRGHNLLTDEYPEGFDLILCRNVIKFFDQDFKRQVQGKLAASLNEGGFLVVSDDLMRERVIDPESLGLGQIEGSCIYRKLPCS